MDPPRTLARPPPRFIPQHLIENATLYWPFPVPHGNVGLTLQTERITNHNVWHENYVNSLFLLHEQWL